MSMPLVSGAWVTPWWKCWSSCARESVRQEARARRTSCLPHPNRSAMTQLKICEMPADDRPREKLAREGPAALQDSELITVLLQSGVVGNHVTEVAEEVLRRAGSLPG